MSPFPVACQTTLLYITMTPPKQILHLLLYLLLFHSTCHCPIHYIIYLFCLSFIIYLLFADNVNSRLADTTTFLFTDAPQAPGTFPGKQNSIDTCWINKEWMKTCMANLQIMRYFMYSCDSECCTVGVLKGLWGHYSTVFLLSIN